MKICQKVLALLLVVCMLGVMIPTMVWAAEASSEDVALLLGKNYDQTPYGLHADFGGYAEAKRITLKKGTLPAGVDYQYSADGFCLVGTPRIEANVQLVFEIDRYGQTTLYHTVNLTVQAGDAPVIVRQPKPVTVVAGSDVTFTVEAAGEGLHYEWWGVDADMPVKIKKDAKSFTLQNVTTDWSGFSFWCRVYNAAGEVLTQKALLTVKSAYQFPFKDVPFGTWYRKDVENANLLGLINGTSATTYEPLKQLDIASAIKLAACMRVLYEGGDPSTAFPRKAGDAWYQPYVDYAKANNIPYNYPDMKAICTREEFVHIFYAALPAAEYVAINHVADNAIPDYKLSDTFGAEVYAFYRAGILTGTNTAGTFNAKGGINRAEVAAILSRMFDDTARKSITLK